VAQNITSSQVTGYKKRTVEFRGIDMGQITTGENGRIDPLSGMLPKASYGVNFQSGETHPTQRDLDAALQGEGFFQVRTPTGETAYTRAGAFHIKGDRTLVTADGALVLSDGGSPITLQAEGGEISIGTDGIISQGDVQVGRLGVVRFLDNSKLVPVGGGMFRAPEGVAVIPTDKALVLQGHLEASNVTPLREMVALVQIARAYEANQKLLSTRDQMLQRTLESLG
jgi:flagellar basal-body rod protein FlgF